MRKPLDPRTKAAIIIFGFVVLVGIASLVFLFFLYYPPLQSAHQEIGPITKRTNAWIREQRNLREELQGEVEELVRLRRFITTTADQKERMAELVDKLAARFPRLRREIESASGYYDDDLANMTLRELLEEHRANLRREMSRKEKELARIEKEILIREQGREE